MRFGQKNLEKDFDEVEQYDVVKSCSGCIG
jgi:hypothetical protein